MREKTKAVVTGLSVLLSALGVLPASADYHYVNLYSTNTPVPPYTDYNTPAVNIQDAVDASQAGDIVLVGPGAYVTGVRATPGASLLNRVVVTNAITVLGAYGRASTLIVGAGPTGGAGVRCAYLSGGATLSGFTLTDGHTRTSGDALKDCSGGGAYALGGTLDDCIISGNTAATNGGGVCRGVVMNSVISGNGADAGGGIFGGTANNCLIVSNAAASGGGGANAGGLNNCTVCGNTAASGGGAYETAVNNSIVYYNSAGTNANSYAGTFSHSCVVPDPGGAGNTVAAPGFVSYPGDLHLAYGSPCIDAGDNARTAGSTDLDRNSRIMNGTVDMGAYEFVFVNVSGSVRLDYAGLEGVTVSDGTRSNVTDAGGSYTVAGVPAGSHTLTARKANYIFQPASLTITVTNADVLSQNFTAQRFHVAAAINCGGASYTDANGVAYDADRSFLGGTLVSTGNPISNTADGPLYQSGRLGASYSLPLTNADYLLTLKFAEIQQTGSALRVFSALAGGQAFATNLDIFALAGGRDRAWDITKPVTVTNGSLNIAFSASVGSPLVNAILVVLDETGLVSGPMGTPTWWLRQHGLTNDSLSVEEMKDTDGDGMAAWEEYAAGTDPTNKANRFCVADVSQSVSGRLQIAVATVPGKKYRLQATTNIVSGRWAGCLYATTTDGALQSATVTAAVDRTSLYVLPSSTPTYYRAKIDIPLTHPFDAVAYGGHYYKVFAASATWHEMKVQCEDMGGYLACVESAGEQAFLTTLANGAYLALGGTDEAASGDWKWVNGSPFGQSPWAGVYTAWGMGQPNHSFDVEHYVELFDGGFWNDVANNRLDYGDPPYAGAYWMPIGYICEWER